MFKWLYNIPDEKWDRIETVIGISAVLLVIVESVIAWIVTRGI